MLKVKSLGQPLARIGVVVHVLWLLVGVYLAGRGVILITLGVGLLLYLWLWLKMKRVKPPLEAVGNNAFSRCASWHLQGLEKLSELPRTALIIGLFVGWLVVIVRVMGSYEILLAATRAGESGTSDIRALWLTLIGLAGPAAFYLGGRRLRQ